jgi:hypothetical protein
MVTMVLAVVVVQVLIIVVMELVELVLLDIMVVADYIMQVVVNLDKVAAGAAAAEWEVLEAMRLFLEDLELQLQELLVTEVMELHLQ